MTIERLLDFEFDNFPSRYPYVLGLQVDLVHLLGVYKSLDIGKARSKICHIITVPLSIWVPRIILEI